MNDLKVKVRFNHDAISEKERWRVLVERTTFFKEYLCSSVTFFCHTKTTKDKIYNHTYFVDKWHITAINPQSIEVLKDEEGALSIVVT